MITKNKWALHLIIVATLIFLGACENSSKDSSIQVAPPKVKPTATKQSVMKSQVKPTATIAVGASNYTAFSDNAADAFNSGVLENSNNNHTTFSFYNNSEVSGTSGSGAMVRQTASAGSIKLSAEL